MHTKFSCHLHTFPTTVKASQRHILRDRWPSAAVYPTCWAMGTKEVKYQSVQWGKKYFVLGRLEKPRQAQWTNKGKTPFICTLWVLIQLSFHSQQGQPLSSLFGLPCSPAHYPPPHFPPPHNLKETLVYQWLMGISNQIQVILAIVGKLFLVKFIFFYEKIDNKNCMEFHQTFAKTFGLLLETLKQKLLIRF